MSVLNPAADEALGESSGGGSSRRRRPGPSLLLLAGPAAADRAHRQGLVLRRAEELAAQDRLKEALDAFALALRYGSGRPEQLGALVGCVLRNFKKAEAAGERSASPAAEPLDCPGCGRLLSEPVTAACGHTYCRRCLQREVVARCPRCAERLAARRGDGGAPRTNVALCHVLEKWVPGGPCRARLCAEIEGLCGRRRYEEALAVSSGGLKAGELKGLLSAHTGAGGGGGGVVVTGACSRIWGWGECVASRGEKGGGRCRGPGMGGARETSAWILYDLLSPGRENVKVGLRETAPGSSPRLRGKVPVADAHGGAALRLEHPSSEEQRAVPEPCEGLEKPGLSRAHSLRGQSRLGSPAGEEGLKRVSSAPQLCGQDKGALLKRKLSSSEQGPSVAVVGRNKHKKQGESLVTSATVIRRVVAEELLEVTDFECSLCMRLFYEPVTTPCGHTFCKSCLERCLDHMPQCPLCKESLKEVSRVCFRSRARSCSNDIVLPSACSFVDYGCMLQIRSVHFLPDGRSVVDTLGGKRFRVLKKGMRDGYCIADIDYLEDVKVQDVGELSRLQELHDQVYTQACTWFQHLKDPFRGQILQHFGAMPGREEDIQATPNGPACCWWLLAVLPVDRRYQLSVLSMTSLKERLLKIQHILTYLQSIPSE
nr:PREDICTED: LON peptidase N-terminal domain and RING finger protein 1 [Lepisosteus oculatus]